MDATRNQSGEAGMPGCQEFDPKFRWMDDRDSKTLVLDVPEFKKENLKVQLDNRGRQIRVSGSRPLEDNRWKRFSRDFQVPENGDTGSIRAKFDNSSLSVTVPLLKSADTSRAATTEEEKKEEEDEKKNENKTTKSKVSNVVVVIVLLLLVLGSYIIVQRFMKQQPPQQLQQVLETGEEGISNWIAHP